MKLACILVFDLNLVPNDRMLSEVQAFDRLEAKVKCIMIKGSLSQAKNIAGQTEIPVRQYQTDLKSYVKKFADKQLVYVFHQHVPSSNVLNAFHNKVKKIDNTVSYRPGFVNGSDIRAEAIEYYPRKQSFFQELQKKWSRKSRDKKVYIDSLGFACDREYLVDYATSYWPFPIQVSVLIGNQCNLSCMMCPIHGPDKFNAPQTDYYDKPKKMTRELFEKIATKTGEYKSIIKIGNIEEPLLYSQLPYFVKFARDAGVRGFHVTTNGTLLTPDLGLKLMDAGLTSIFISIDAHDTDHYSQIRGFDLQTVNRNLKIFLDNTHKKDLSISTGVAIIKQDPVADDEINDFTKYWLESGVDRVVVYQKSRVVDGEDVFDDLFFPVPETRHPCPLPWTEMYVLPEGEVITCCRGDLMIGRRGIYSLGNAAEDDLDVIWRGEGYRRYRKALFLNQPDALPELCKGCSIFSANVIREYVKDGYHYSGNSFLQNVKIDSH